MHDVDFDGRKHRQSRFERTAQLIVFVVLITVGLACLVVKGAGQ